MKRYFAGWTIAVALLVLTGIASGQNLQLILEGPFVVCENPGTETLTIAIPNLQGTHYVPAFTSDLSYLSLGTDGKGAAFGAKYHAAKDGMTITIHSNNWPGGNHLMALNPTQRNAPAAYFYSEKGDCNQQNRNLESVVFTVPFPDEVWALNPTVDDLYITDHKDKSKHKGECGNNYNNGCPHATKLVLRYLGVDLTKLEIDTTCKARNCTAHDNWFPDTSAARGGEFEIELSAEPIPTKHEQSHAKTAFRAASKVSGIDRDLNYPSFSMRYPVLHKVCQIPPIFLCSKYADDKKCPAN